MENIQSPIKKTRNELGLIDGINYQFTQDGLIDWRKMINSDFLVPNKQAFERYNKPVPKSIDGLEDKELLILLAGIKELAQIRGYRAVKHTVTSPTNDYVVSVCTIDWTANYETEGREVSFSAIGDASPFNTTSFGKNYLGPIAENRAFVRSVRNFLRINIVAQEELGASGTQSDEQVDSPSALLQSVMTSHGVDFDKVKSALIKDKYPEAELITSLDQIAKFKQFELIERIKKAAAQAVKS
jgi:hypothetical protein